MDGSSVFGKDNKYGYFPSLAASWRLNEESFMKKIDWISNLKLRTSWGQVGNQAVDPYSTLGVTERYINEFGGENNVQIGFLPGDKLWNPKLKWETTTSTNIGLDFGFSKNVSVVRWKSTRRKLRIYLSHVKSARIWDMPPSLRIWARWKIRVWNYS